MTGQHTVQRFHLAQFAGQEPQGHVWVYDCRKPDPRSGIPENVSTENNFYSVEREDGTWDTRLDDWITSIESRATPIYVELLKGKIPEYSQAKYDFAQYLSLTYVRTRTMRRISAETAGQMFQVTNYAHGTFPEVFESIIGRFEKERGETFTPETKEKVRKVLLDPSDFIISMPKEYGFKAFSLLDDLTDIFLNTYWSIVEADRGFYITSDNPILRQVQPGTVHPMYGDHGFKNKTMQVTFPLSPSKILLLTYFRPPSNHWSVAREVVAEQNMARASHCEHEIYSHLRHKHLIKLSQKYADQRQGWKMTGFGPEKYAEIELQRRRKKR